MTTMTVTVEMIVEHLRSLEGNNGVNMVAKGMEYLQKVAPSMDGVSKKQLLIDAVAKISKDESAALSNIFKTMIETNLVGDLIDTAASLAKGKFDVAKIKENVQDISKVGKSCMPIFAKIRALLAKKPAKK